MNFKNFDFHIVVELELEFFQSRKNSKVID